MKKTLSLVAALGLGLAMSAQTYDLGITLDAPAASGTIMAGTQFNFDVTFSNLGSEDFTTQDTVLFAPVLNGNFLQNSNGNPVIFFETAQSIPNTSGTHTASRGLTISGGSGQMPIAFCGVIVTTWGPNWRGVTDADSTNNADCNNVTYDASGGGVSLTEDVINVRDLLSVYDASYFADKQYFVQVYNVFHQEVRLNFMDLTGRQIASHRLDVVDGKVESQIDMSAYPAGIMLSVLEIDGKVESSKKVVLR